MDSLTFGDHTFTLDVDGMVQVNPRFTGDEPNPLELSIAKWKFIVKTIEAGNAVLHCGGVTTCALCVKLMSCDDCPVVVRRDGCKDTLYMVRRDGCKDTPYIAFANNPTLENANAELEFLESLRDE